MAIKFDFNKMRTAVQGWLTGTDVTGTSLTSGEEAIYVPKLRNAMPVKHISAAASLYSSDSGSLVLINQAAAYAITLPAPADAGAGWHANFVVATAASNAVTITCTGTDLFHGFDMAQEGGDVAWGATEGTGIDVITIISGATKGDRVDIYCDGVSYYYLAFAADVAHITVAAE